MGFNLLVTFKIKVQLCLLVATSKHSYRQITLDRSPPRNIDRSSFKVESTLSDVLGKHCHDYFVLCLIIRECWVFSLGG